MDEKQDGAVAVAEPDEAEEAVKITELVEFRPTRVDGVATPASGFPVLIMKSVADGATSVKPAEVPDWLPAAKALLAAAIADPKADPGDLYKAVNAAGEVDEGPDIAGGKQAIALIGKLIEYEAQELEAGELDETCDIGMLLQAADCLRCWLCMEQSADAMKGCGCCGLCTGPGDGCCPSCGVAKAEAEDFTYAADDVAKDSRTFTAAERKKHAKEGNALPDGCLAAETPVITPDGTKSIADMLGPCRVLTDQGWSDAEVREYGAQALRAVVLRRGTVERTVYATAGHRWYLADGQVKLTSELGPADSIGYVRPLGFSHAEVAPLSSSARSDAPGVHTVPPESAAGGLLLAREPERQAHAQARLQGVREVALAGVGRGVPGAARHAGAHLGAEDPARVRRDPGAVRRDAAGAGFQVPALREAGPGASTAGGRSLPHVRRGARAALRLVQSAARLGRGDRPGAAGGLRGWDVVAVCPTGRVERVYCAVVPGLHRFVLADGILTGNSYPIPDKDALRRAAILARSGHGDVAAARRLIARRARELGVPNPLDEDDKEKGTKSVETVVAEDATSGQTDHQDDGLSKAVEAAVTKALDAHKAELATLRAELAKVQALPRPGGPVMTDTRSPRSTAAGDDHAAKAARYREEAAKVGSQDRELAAGYRQLAEEADKAAKAAIAAG